MASGVDYTHTRISMICTGSIFRNQERARHRPVCAWFKKYSICIVRILEYFAECSKENVGNFRIMGLRLPELYQFVCAH